MSNVKASTIIAKAKTYVGVKESPANSNNVIFNTDYYGKAVSGAAYPWCCAFIWDIFRMCGASSMFYNGNKCAYCPTLYNDFKSKGQIHSTPKPGDIVFYQFSGQTRIGHVGIVAEVISATQIRTIEGNTSSTNDSNGGAVEIRVRSTTYVKGYGRPTYLADDSTAKTVTESTAKTTTSSTYSYSQFVKDVQTIEGVSVDGIAGPKTLGATVTLSKTKNSKHKLVLPVQKYLKLLGYYTGSLDCDFGNLTDKAVRAYQQNWTSKPDGEITAKMTTWKKLLKLS